jgi:hypothetical protein
MLRVWQTETSSAQPRNFFRQIDMAESDNILTKLQDVLVYLIPQLNKFPRDHRGR